jgi:hypothetical protein
MSGIHALLPEEHHTPEMRVAKTHLLQQISTFSKSVRLSADGVFNGMMPNFTKWREAVH